MTDLMQQMDILKGLTDGQLAQEMAAPSGSVAPFVIASEIARRKDMRQRYAGDMAMARPQTTVAQDVMTGFGAAPPGGAMPMPAPGSAGGLAPPVRGYASGGLVDATDAPVVDYADLSRRYQTMLQQDEQERARAAALGLLSAGAGILGGGHSNLGQNLAAGINAGIGTYADRLKAVDTQDSATLNDLIDLGKAQQDAAVTAAKMDPNSFLNTPDAVRTAQAISALPEGPQKDLAMQIATPFAAQKAAVTADHAKTIADGIADGSIPPINTDMYGSWPSVLSSLATEHPDTNISSLQLQWKAAQTAVAHMNSNQVLAQQRNIATVSDQLTNLQSLADQWKGGQFPVLNAINFKAALQGALGPKAQSIAAQFSQQLAETKVGMQQVFGNGYAGTDKQLAQVDKMFSENTSNATFDDLIALARRNIGYRAQALGSATGLPAGNTYSVTPTATAAGAPSAPVAVDPDVQNLLDKYSTAP